MAERIRSREEAERIARAQHEVTIGPTTLLGALSQAPELKAGDTFRVEAGGKVWTVTVGEHEPQPPPLFLSMQKRPAQPEG